MNREQPVVHTYAGICFSPKKGYNKWGHGSEWHKPDACTHTHTHTSFHSPEMQRWTRYRYRKCSWNSPGLWRRGRAAKSWLNGDSRSALQMESCGGLFHNSVSVFSNTKLYTYTRLGWRVWLCAGPHLEKKRRQEKCMLRHGWTLETLYIVRQVSCKTAHTLSFRCYEIPTAGVSVNTASALVVSSGGMRLQCGLNTNGVRHVSFYSKENGCTTLCKNCQ